MGRRGGVRGSSEWVMALRLCLMRMICGVGCQSKLGIHVVAYQGS